MKRRFATIAAATVCSAALIVPVSAGTVQAAPRGNEGSHGQSTEHHGGSHLTADQRAGIRAAKRAFVEAVHSANAAFWTSRHSIRMECKTAMEGATTDEAKAEVRASCKAALKTARETRKAAIESAMQTRKAAIAAIRGTS